MDNIADSDDFKFVKELTSLIHDHKGDNILVLYVGETSGWTDYFIIGTVRSQKHLSSLYQKIRLFLKEHKVTILNNSEKPGSSGWLLIDCGHFIIHLMDKEQRQFYELEKLWFSSPVVFQSSKSS